MDIAFALDKNYIQHLCVVVRSIRAHNNCDLTVYILNADLSEKDIKFIEEDLAAQRIKTKFLTVAENNFSAFPVSRHINYTTYLRLLLPNILLELDKILYLDLDIIVNGRLHMLWDTSIDQAAFAAVPEFCNIRNIEMGLGNTSTANAGVLLFNLNYWRENKLSEKVFQFLQESHDIRFWDQDAINAVCLNNWIKLPVKYNSSMGYYYARARREITDRRLLSQLEQPVIIHFSASFKPWHYKLRHPFKHLYYRYLKQTPFANFKPLDRSFKNLVLKAGATVFSRLALRN